MNKMTIIILFAALCGIVLWALVDYLRERRHEKRMAKWVSHSPKKKELKPHRLYAWEQDAPYDSVVRDRFN
jgi:hypothetical protein